MRKEEEGKVFYTIESTYMNIASQTASNIHQHPTDLFNKTNQANWNEPGLTILFDANTRQFHDPSKMSSSNPHLMDSLWPRNRHKIKKYLTCSPDTNAVLALTSINFHKIKTHGTWFK